MFTFKLMFCSKIKAAFSAATFFLHSKKVWRKPNKAKVLIYDREGSVPLLEYIDINSVEILDVRGESINAYILFKTILLKTFVPNKNYFNHYIDFVNPSYIITFIDNNLNFYLLKDKHPDRITIFVQNGYRSEYNDIFSVLNEAKKNCRFYHVDHMLTFSRVVGKKYSQYIKGKVTPIGSLKNNAYRRSYPPKNRSVVFISEYRPALSLTNLLHWRTGEKPINIDEFRSAECSVLPFLGRYCHSNNLNLKICESTSEHNGEEYNYYKSLLGDYDWQFLPRLDLYSSYKHINESEFVTFIHSTLGYESLACGKKTVAFYIRGRMLGLSDLNFGWPAILPDSGPFWTNLNDEQEFERLMDYITTVSDEEWEKTRQRYVPDLIEYNPNNNRFIVLMRELGVPLNEQYQNANVTSWEN